MFQYKNNLIPALYEVTKNDLIKHDQIFNELLKLSADFKLTNLIGIGMNDSLNKTLSLKILLTDFT